MGAYVLMLFLVFSDGTTDSRPHSWYPTEYKCHIQEWQHNFRRKNKHLIYQCQRNAVDI